MPFWWKFQKMPLKKHSIYYNNTIIVIIIHNYLIQENWYYIKSKKDKYKIIKENNRFFLDLCFFLDFSFNLKKYICTYIKMKVNVEYGYNNEANKRECFGRVRFLQFFLRRNVYFSLLFHQNRRFCAVFRHSVSVPFKESHV